MVTLLVLILVKYFTYIVEIANCWLFNAFRIMLANGNAFFVVVEIKVNWH